VDDERLVEFFANLAVAELVGLLSPGDRELLRVSTLFSIPVPRPVLATLATGLGPSPPREAAGDRLAGLGLWEVHAPDSAESVLLNGLTRPPGGGLYWRSAWRASGSWASRRGSRRWRRSLPP
jgi:hypothetical protein